MTTETQVIAEGYAYDPATRAHTTRVEYIARNQMEAIRWMNFQKNWFKRLRIVPAAPAALKTKGTFYVA